MRLSGVAEQGDTFVIWEIPVNELVLFNVKSHANHTYYRKKNNPDHIADSFIEHINWLRYL